MPGIDGIYAFFKLIYLYSFVRCVVKYEPLQRHTLFIACMYTAGVGFLFWVFYLTSMPTVDWWPVKKWLGLTLLFSWIYFRLLARFDEGFFFVILIVAGLGLVWF